MADYLENLAYCGLYCGGCPIFWATRETDPQKKHRMRVAIARIIGEQYGRSVIPEEITDCDGCRKTGGRLFASCVDCRIRPCAQGRGHETCAACSDYPCSNLKPIFDSDPGARGWLEVVRGVKL
jgi:hypothetical protein